MVVVTVTIELPKEVQARLESEAHRRGVTLEQLITQFAAELPDGDDALEAFIGCGSSGRNEPFDIHRERAELAARKLADGI